MITIFYVKLEYIFLTGTFTGNMQETCMSEYFQAECPDGHVVMILSALYGRMRVGRCARQGNMGCVVDALAYLDMKCSGRQRCNFMTPDENLSSLNPCPTNYAPYLEAVFSCISGKGTSIHT